MVESVHDISDGGLFVALVESAMPNELGFNIETDTNFRKDAYLFGESQSRAIVSVAANQEDDLVNYLNSNNVAFSRLGDVGGKNIIVDEENYGGILDWKLIYETTLGRKMEESVVDVTA